jgi:hypothetical protein
LPVTGQMTPAVAKLAAMTVLTIIIPIQQAATAAA